MDSTVSFLLSHWPFLAYSIISLIVVHVCKGILWTKKNVDVSKVSPAIWWARKTLPLHPVVIGLLVGLIPGVPASAGIEAVAAKCLYFGGAGASSTWIFDVIKGIAKQRGFDLKLPGASHEAAQAPAEPLVEIPEPNAKTTSDG